MFSYITYYLLSLIYRHGLTLYQVDQALALIALFVGDIGDLETHILKTYGAPGLALVIFMLGGKALWEWFKIRQKRADDLNDTMIGRIKTQDTEHTIALKEIASILDKGLEGILSKTEESISFKREISNHLVSIMNEQKQQRTLILVLARAIPIKDERRKALTEGEIRDILRLIREEYQP